VDASGEPGPLSFLGTTLARAIVPVVCPGCGRPDVRWCGDCAAPWWEVPYRSESGAGRLDVLGRAPLPVWSIAPLVGPPHLMIAAWKDGRRRDMDAFFREAMARAVAEVAPALGPVTIVVPVPARPSSTRKRGVDLPWSLAEAAVSGLATRGRSVFAVRCLTNAGAEARRLGSRARWSGSAAGIGVRSAPLGEVALLVDDVVTTGATLARSCEALERAGVAIAAAVTLAATPLPGANRDLSP
jgi:predicted amidophosphoribosyltransferase